MKYLPYCLFSAVCLMVVVPAARAKNVELSKLEQKLEQVFSPGDYERAAFSEDGQYLAYTRREGGDLFAFVVKTAAPGDLIGKVRIGTVETTEVLASRGRSEGLDLKMPPEAITMEWYGDRLVVFTNLCAWTAASGQTIASPGALLSFNPDGSRAKVLATTAYYGMLSDFRRLDSRHVVLPYMSAESRRVTVGVITHQDYDYFTLDVTTGKEGDSTYKSWLAAKRSRETQRPNAEILKGCQKALGGQFENHQIELLGAYPAGGLAALLVQSPADPGTFYMFSAKQDKLYEIGRAQSDIHPDKYIVSRWTEAFDGKSTRIVLITPALASERHKGLVVMIPNAANREADDAYYPDAMAIATLGYPVLEMGMPKLAAHSEQVFNQLVLGVVGKMLPVREGETLPVAFMATHSTAPFFYKLPFLEPRVFSGGVFLAAPPVRKPNPVYRMADDGSLIQTEGKPAAHGEPGLGLCLYRYAPSHVADVNRAYAINFCAGLESVGIHFEYDRIDIDSVVMHQPEAESRVYARIDAYLQEFMRQGSVKLGPTRVVK